MSDSAENDFEQHLKEPEWESMSGKPIDLHQLLSWSTKHSRNDLTKPDSTLTSTASEQAQPREPLDTKWIDLIMGKSDAVRMKDCMERLLNLDLSLEDRLEAVDELELLVESLDNAQDFCKLNLLHLLVPCLRKFQEHELRFHVMWVLGTMVQNNAQVKKMFLDKNVIVAVLDRLRTRDETVEVKAKAIYMLSGFLKHNVPGQTLMSRLNGYQIVNDAFRLHIQDLQFAKKILFMLQSIITSATSEISFESLIGSEHVFKQLTDTIVELIISFNNSDVSRVVADDDLHSEEVLELSFKLLQGAPSIETAALQQALVKTQVKYPENDDLKQISFHN